MRLIIDRIIQREIMHYAGPDLRISSYHNRVCIDEDSGNVEVGLPDTALSRVVGWSRLWRRALRLDKCNVVPVGDGLVIVRQGRVYHYDRAARKIADTLRLRQCRNVLHQSITTIEGKELFFGEYGTNGQREAVPVYRSRDGGRSWEVVYEFPKGRTRHVHGCYWDPYEKKVWVLTGDLAGECRVLVADKNFDDIEQIGDGSQTYRACNVFFERDAVHWIMDSPLEASHHVTLDRRTRKPSQLTQFPGPVWYIKRLADGYYLAATAQEIGPGVRDDYSHLMVSADLRSWESVHQFEHDGLPRRFFKFGVIGFADGLQSSERFYIFGEAIKGLDGRVAQCRLES
jgi:hypothetical protein